MSLCSYRESTLLISCDETLMLDVDDLVRPETDMERTTYADIAKITGTNAKSISARWREPSLTIHNITVSGSSSELCGT